MVGDEENTEFIGENVKKEQVYQKQEKDNAKRAQINSVIYFGATMAFLCIIVLLFWQLQKRSKEFQSKYIGFHKRDAHLLVITQQEIDYFDQLSEITKIENCTQNPIIEQENTLIFLGNNQLNEQWKDCFETLKPKFSDILLIIYNATQESILQESEIQQYYISNQTLDIKNPSTQKFEGYKEEEQIEIVEQIINNIFK